MKTDSHIKNWCQAGILALIISGSILHFVFPWTGELKIIGIIAPVNESVWEHLKMGYWSLTFFSIFEYKKIKNQVNNYFFAKLIGILALELTIIIVFYSYTFITRNSILWIDISSYVVGSIMCQVVVYQLQKQKPVSVFINRLALTGFICLGILLGVTTFYTPPYPLFQDSRNDTYGINKDHLPSL